MKSYIHVPGNAVVSWQTIPERLKSLAEENPEKCAFVMYQDKYNREEITRKMLYDGTVKFAKALIKLGVQKGDYVAVCISNCVDLMIYDSGVIMAGAISVRLSISTGNFNSLLHGCKIVIFDSEEAVKKLRAIAEIYDNGKVKCEIYPELKFVITISEKKIPQNVLSSKQLMLGVNGSEKIDLPHLEPEEIAIISQTSGTTGHPKRIYHTHYNWLNCSIHMIEQCGMTSEDTTYNTRPMLYIGGYPFGYMTVGNTHVTGKVSMLNDINNLDFIENLWKKENCKVLWLLPQHLKLLRECGYQSKVIFSGGDLLSKESLEYSLNFTKNIYLIYGSSEAAFVTSRLFNRDNISEHKPNMIGKCLPDTEIKVVDDEEKTVDIGVIGNFYVRSKWMAKRMEKSAFTPESEWQSMSDIGYMSREGDLFLLGRNTDFIKKSTVKLSVKQIEEYISHHPSIKYVVVVSIPDDEVGERVCACVTIHSNQKFNEEELKRFCQEKMPQDKDFDFVSMQPDYFVYFQQFPSLSSQKFDRRAIKAAAIAKLEK
ncbi:uncharacterized protein LOC115215238 [Argonauta hians]